MLDIKNLITCAVALLFCIASIGCTYKNGDDTEGGEPVKTGELSAEIIEKIKGQTGIEIAFLAVHDIVTGEPRLLLRNDDSYKTLDEKEKKRFLSEPYEIINTSKATITTVKKNPWCQVIVIDGSIEVICSKI